MKKILVCIALLCLPTAGYAASGGGLYEIEVLIFKHLQEELEGDELWANNLQEMAADDTTRPATTPLEGKTPNERSLLSETADTLMHKPNYELMFHKRWVQNAEAKSKAKPLALKTDDQQSDSGMQLDGNIRFYLSRYYHLDVDLSMREAGKHLLPFRPGKEDDQLVYTIKQDRRIKTKELHYFDHPKFGMLVMVRPLRRR